MGKSSEWFLRIQEEESLRENVDTEFDTKKSIQMEEPKQPKATEPLDDLFAAFGKIFGSNEGKSI